MKLVDKLLNKIIDNKRLQFIIFLVVLILLSALFVYYSRYMFMGHDFNFHYHRFESLKRALFEGNFPTYLNYIDMDGYGYLSNIFYPDFTLIPFAVIAQYTSNLISFKILIFVMSILCGLFTYKLVKLIFKNNFMAAVVAILYTFCNYRILDIYTRASIGEFMCFTFIPLIFIGLYHIIKGDYQKKWYIITIGFCLMIYTHVISTLLMAIIVSILVLIFYRRLLKEPKRILFLGIAALVSIAISTFYLVPFWEQTNSNEFYYSAFAWTSPHLNKIGTYQLLWGMTTSLSLPGEDYLPRLGLLPTLLIVMKIFVNDKSKNTKLANIFLVLGLILLIAMTYFFPWGYGILKPLDIIQFPSRLLQISSFFIILAGSYYFATTIKSLNIRFVLTTIVLVFICYIIKGESDYSEKLNCGKRTKVMFEKDITLENSDYLVFGAAEYYPKQVPTIFYSKERGEVVKSNNAESNITNLRRNKGILSFDIKTSKKESLELPLVYYKGYEVKLNNKAIETKISSNGLIEIEVDESGKIESWYAGTSIQKNSFYFTIISIFVLCIWILLTNIKKRNEQI